MSKPVYCAKDVVGEIDRWYQERYKMGLMEK